MLGISPKLGRIHENSQRKNQKPIVIQPAKLTDSSTGRTMADFTNTHGNLNLQSESNYLSWHFPILVETPVSNKKNIYTLVLSSSQEQIWTHGDVSEHTHKKKDQTIARDGVISDPKTHNTPWINSTVGYFTAQTTQTNWPPRLGCAKLTAPTPKVEGNTTKHSTL